MRQRKEQALSDRRGAWRPQGETPAERKERAANLRWAAEHMQNEGGARELRAFADQLEEEAEALERDGTPGV
jgi:hypothetical protein